MTVRPIDLEKLESKAENIYEAIVLMSKRARQINEETKIEFNQRLEMIQTKIGETAEEETEKNPDQEKISLEFEKRPKPTENAMEELLSDKVEYRYKDVEPETETQE